MPLPAAPADLRSGLKEETFVGLIWTVDDPSPQYNIYRESAGKPAEYVGYAKVETFYDRTVEPGVEYTYWVKAKNATGESPPSASFKVTTPLARDLDHLDEVLEAAYADGLIFDKGVLNSLLAKVNQAQQGKENTSNALRALEQELSALAGNQADVSFVRKIREDLLYLVEQAEL
ncbi:fibronectin type III domain-containing protein [Paenibacillus sp. CC-CFT747]|nr:fibronectin type III domain-containing protein [Paenibacillus sp. CC-CFT747]